jgi:hypothetical protein
MQILAHLAATIATVADEEFLQFRQQIGARPEVAEIAIAVLFLRLHFGAHRHAVVAVEGVAFDDLCLQAFAAKDMLKALHHGAGSGAG